MDYFLIRVNLQVVFDGLLDSTFMIALLLAALSY
jgi:hypothetical protein